MPEEATDYDVGDGLPEDQEEDDEQRKVVLSCCCGAYLEILVRSDSDIPIVAKASNWVVNSHRMCPRCQ